MDHSCCAAIFFGSIYTRRAGVVTHQLSSDTATENDFLRRYFFDDLATPNRQMILANIFWEAFMKSLIVKRSVDIDGHKTSVSLEDAFWSDLKKIAYMQRRCRRCSRRSIKGVGRATYLQRYACSYSTKSALTGTCGDILAPDGLRKKPRKLMSRQCSRMDE